MHYLRAAGRNRQIFCLYFFPSLRWAVIFIIWNTCLGNDLFLGLCTIKDPRIKPESKSDRGMWSDCRIIAAPVPTLLEWGNICSLLLLTSSIHGQSCSRWLSLATLQSIDHWCWLHKKAGCRQDGDDDQSGKWELGVCTQSLVVLAAAPLLLAGDEGAPQPEPDNFIHYCTLYLLWHFQVGLSCQNDADIFS